MWLLLMQGLVDLDLVGQLYPTSCYGRECYTLGRLQDAMEALFLSPIVRGLVALSMGLGLAYLSLRFLRHSVGILTSSAPVEGRDPGPEYATGYDGERRENRATRAAEYE
jgi:hypothetical protein